MYNPFAPKLNYYQVHTTVVQKYIEHDLDTTRPWTSYPADIIERLLWKYRIIPPTARYAKFDVDAENLIFREVIYEEVYVDFREDEPKVISKEEFDKAFPLQKERKQLPPPKEIHGGAESNQDSVDQENN